MASIIIRELKPGESFRDCLFSRSRIEKKVGTGNKPDVKLTLAHNFHHYSAKKWKLTTEEEQALSDSQFLVVSGDIEKGGTYDGEITITSVRPAQSDEIPLDVSPYLRPRHEDHEKHLAQFEGLTQSVQEPNLRGLLDKIFDKEKPIWPLFCCAQAAGKKHHAYQGGLLHHSIEVAELCALAADVLPALSRDLLVACALLHDIGKLNEMDHGLNAGEYSAAGVLNGHISLGSSRVRQMMNTIKGFPPLLKESVTHMILSHHGVLEYGSPVLPKFAEAQVLAQCDLISARVFEYSEAAKNANGQLSVWLAGRDSVQIYTGDLGLQKSETLTVLPKPSQAFQTAASCVPAFQTTRMPIRGLVAAGAPEQGNADDDETREVVPPTCGADFLVRVTGDSMADEGIRERDLLFVKEIETPKDGDIVIAHVGAPGEVVKRFRFAASGSTGHERKWLESENSSKNYPDIAVDSDTRIRGKVVGLLRDF